jgi:hypothetical protein
LSANGCRFHNAARVNRIALRDRIRRALAVRRTSLPHPLTGTDATGARVGFYLRDDFACIFVACDDAASVVAQPQEMALVVAGDGPLTAEQTP